MRKVLYFCLLGCLFLVTGCGGKTLKCSKNNDSPDGMTKIFQELDVVFKNDKPSSMSFKMDVSVDDALIEANGDIVNGLANSASSEFDNIKEERGVSYSLSKKEKSFSAKLNLNFDKMDDEVKKKVYLINHQGNYSTIKSELERQGYSCK